VSTGRLSSLQVDVLAALDPIVPPWTLTGGAALAADHTRQRTTGDPTCYGTAVTSSKSFPRSSQIASKPQDSQS
jgi:hypothetical protein